MKTILMLSLLLIASCAEKKRFAGGSADATPAATDQPQPMTSTPTTDKPATGQPAIAGIDACVEGDRVVYDWTGPVKDCIDAGKTWHFEAKACVDMPKASFTCDWATVQTKLKELNLLTETLKNDAAAGAKLISCGQSMDGNRVAVQWIKPVSGVSCQKLQEGFGITTGCYTHYVDREPPPPATTDDERRQRVNDCLKSL